MVLNLIAAFLSLLLPGFGHFVKFRLGKGIVVMIFYLVVLLTFATNPGGLLALVIFIPIFHLWAAVSAYRA